MIFEQYKGAHYVDLGKSFQTHVYLQIFASIQPRTSPPRTSAQWQRPQVQNTVQTVEVAVAYACCVGSHAADLGEAGVREILHGGAEARELHEGFVGLLEPPPSVPSFSSGEAILVTRLTGFAT